MCLFVCLFVLHLHSWFANFPRPCHAHYFPCRAVDIFICLTHILQRPATTRGALLTWREASRAICYAVDSSRWALSVGLSQHNIVDHIIGQGLVTALANSLEDAMQSNPELCMESVVQLVEALVDFSMVCYGPELQGNPILDLLYESQVMAKMAPELLVGLWNDEAAATSGPIPPPVLRSARRIQRAHSAVVSFYYHGFSHYMGWDAI